MYGSLFVSISLVRVTEMVTERWISFREVPHYFLVHEIRDRE